MSKSRLCIYKHLTAGVLACSIFTSAAAAESTVLTERLQKLLSSDRPLVIAHRGFKMAAPENTLPAFRLGLRAHADLVELDYYHSSDGIPVVIHDRTFDRTTNAVEMWGAEGTAIHSKTYQEMSELDAGSWFSSDYAGTRIPTLDESLDLIQPGAITLIERKAGDAQTIVELLEGKGISNDVIIQSFDWQYIADCHALAPHIPLGALGPPKSFGGQKLTSEERFLNTAFLDAVEESGASVVGWNRQVTGEAVREAQDRGLKVWIYTINDLETALRLLEMGVDGIISDDPAMVWKALALHWGERSE